MSKKRKKKIVLLTCALITSIILFIIVCVLFLDSDKKKNTLPETSGETSSEISSMTEESSVLVKGETYKISGKDGIRIFNIEEIKTNYKNYFENYNEKEVEKTFKILEGTLVSSKYNVSGIEGTVVDFREVWDEGFGDITALTDTNELYCGNVEYNNNTKKTDINFLKLDTTIKIERLIGPYYYGIGDIVVPINRVYAVSTQDKIYQVTYEYESESSDDFKFILEKKDDSIFSFSNINIKLDKDGYLSLYMNTAKSFRTINSLNAKEVIEVINGDYYVVTTEDYLYKIKIEDEDSSLDSSYELVNDNKISLSTGYKKVDADNDTQDSFEDGYNTGEEIEFTFER